MYIRKKTLSFIIFFLIAIGLSFIMIAFLSYETNSIEFIVAATITTSMVIMSWLAYKITIKKRPERRRSKQSFAISSFILIVIFISIFITQYQLSLANMNTIPINSSILSLFGLAIIIIGIFIFTNRYTKSLDMMTVFKEQRRHRRKNIKL